MGLSVKKKCKYISFQPTFLLLKNVKKEIHESQKNILLYYIISNICSYVKYWSFNTNTASSLNTIRLRYVGKPNQTKTKTKTKTKPTPKNGWLLFLIEEFLIEEFNRLILCSGIFSVYLGNFSVSLGSISEWFGSISDILGFISDRYLYKHRSDFKAINLLDDK